MSAGLSLVLSLTLLGCGGGCTRNTDCSSDSVCRAGACEPLALPDAGQDAGALADAGADGGQQPGEGDDGPPPASQAPAQDPPNNDDDAGEQ